MPTVKTTGEYYTVATDTGSGAALRGETREGRFEHISDAVESAMRITLDRCVGCNVLRVTTHEPIPDPTIALNGMFGPSEMTCETVTGQVSIPGPRSYAFSPALSRYHPVNGWVVPETIEIDEPL